MAHTTRSTHGNNIDRHVSACHLCQLLAKVVVNSVDVLFREVFANLIAQVLAALQIVAKGLLDDHAKPALLVARPLDHQLGALLPDHAANLGVGGWRHCKIEQAAGALRIAVTLPLCQRFLQRLVALRLVVALALLVCELQHRRQCDAACDGCWRGRK